MQRYCFARRTSAYPSYSQSNQRCETILANFYHVLSRKLEYKAKIYPNIINELTRRSLC
jgi:hypothetical protein